ncbi:MAG: ribonuclease III [Pseudomonadota bacterium]|nr:ribonuclease III [Pseudomonadota bacterium]
MSIDTNITATLEALQFSNPKLLEQALIHKSFFIENRDLCEGDNEKLEFLGDAVLDLVVSDLLLKKFPLDAEGDLSQKRASLVNESTLALISLELDIGKLIKLGRGERTAGGDKKPRILASTLEAIVGALFLDSGYSSALKFLAEIFHDRINSLVGVASNQDDYKTRYQELVQRTSKSTPLYDLISESGPDHDKLFVVGVKVDGVLMAEGLGRSKKMAEQLAAKKALEEVT